jgi:HlyD family secretion protein
MTAKRKSRKLLYIIIAVVIVVIAGFAFAAHAKKQKPTEVTIDKVIKRDITSQVTASGTVAPKTEVTISSEVAGEIVEMPVNDGDRVKKGDLLVRIDTETLELRVAQQEAAIASAKATAEKLHSQVDRTDKLLEDQQRLFENKYVSEDTLREARMNAEVNRSAYKAAQADIANQQTQLDQAKKNLSKAIIYSPMDGIISSRAVEIGDRVVGTGDYAGTEIMKVADFGVMNVEIDVNEADVVQVKNGDKATISIDAISDTSFPGTVVEIASSATTSTDETAAVTFKIKVHIDENDERIRPGMTATADIDTGHVAGVLSVPLQSVTVRDKQTVAKALGKKDIPEAPAIGNVVSDRKDKKRSRAELDNLQRVVFIYKDGVVKLREVKTGLSDNRFMEIKDGVADGETVVSGSYNAIARELNDGAKVTISKDSTPKGKEPEESEKGHAGPGPR